MAEQQLKRILGRGFSIAASIGLIIGLGILRTPGEIAVTVQDPLIYMSLWVGGGAMVMLSLLVAAELIAITPRSGGMYALIAHAFGPYPGFLIGWTDWVSNAASSALKAVVLVEYVALLVPAIGPYNTEAALLITTFFAGLQLGGVRLSGGIYQYAAAIVGMMMVLLTLLLFFGGFTTEIKLAEALPDAGPASMAAFGLVIASIIFTYDGWMSVSYFGGEIQGGGKMAAHGAIKGLLIVIALYVALNLALVFSVPLTLLQGHDLALAGALDILFGNNASMMITLVAIFILLVHQNIQYMLGTRILYALSVDGLGTDRATSVSERGTPVGSLFFNWALMCLLVVVGGFSFLLNMATLLWISMYIAVMVGVFRLRKQEPDIERPYRAWGFPLTGYICVVFWTGIAGFIAVTDSDSSLFTMGLIAVSLPAYYWLKKKRQITT